MAKGTPDKGAAGSKSGGRPASGARPAPGSKSSRARKPPPVVTKQPRPWGWIAAAVAVAVFAAAAIGYAVVQVNERNELADPANIEGLVTKTFPSQLHVEGPVDYGADAPPFGGSHNITWADCNGDVYPIQIANENAVHGLEHGAVWVTYNPDLAQDQIDELASMVEGEQFLFMSPYEGLSTPISLQSWGHQLKVDSADDPRVEAFITALRLNPDFTPELGASCDNPAFAANPVPAPLPGTPVPNETTAPTGSVDPAAPTTADPSSSAVPSSAAPTTAP